MKIIPVLLTLILFSCSNSHNKNNLGTSNKSDSLANKILDTNTVEKIRKKTVIIVPCSNGYKYNLREGDLNPSLTKHLKSSRQISVLPFPLSKFNGSGFQGVYDKKYATKILTLTDSDYLIFTKMVSNHFYPRPLKQIVNWGYEVKILNTKTLNQTIGISDRNLNSFASIDSSLNSKISNLVSKLKSN